jgi:hypothetical protein
LIPFTNKDTIEREGAKNILGELMKESRRFPQFSNACFFFFFYTKLDLEKNKNYIISRVVSRGGSKDELELFRYYGWEVIKSEVIKIRYLNGKILNYLSKLFDIPLENFRCYNNREIF